MALSRDEILNLIEEEFGGLSDRVKLEVANDYNEANNYPQFYENSASNLIDFCNDSLTTYFEYLRHSENYNKGDEYFTIDGYNWWRSFDDVEDEVDTRALAEFVYDHWSRYDNIFEMTDYEISHNEEEDEEESKEEEE